jgi:predicted nucleotidyltransferase
MLVRMTPSCIPLDRLKAALGEGPPLRLAVLFGSAARGKIRPDSDVDVAILPEDPDLPLAVELALQVSLTAACGREVDLVRLDRASTLVRWQVASHGIPLLAGDERAHARFVAAAAAEYIDFAPGFARAAERFRRRLIEDGAAGT